MRETSKNGWWSGRSFLQTWIESISGEDGGALGRAAEQRSRCKAGRKETEKGNSFVYLCEDGATVTELCRRIQVGANSWRKVEGMMGDIHISQKLKGNVPSLCITPFYLYDLDSMTKKEQKVHVCGNNWVRRIAGVKRIDKRRLAELREEVEREFQGEIGEELVKVGWTY